MDCYSDRPEGCDENEVLLTNTPDARLNLTLTPLRKYTNYSICVRVFNSKGAIWYLTRNFEFGIPFLFAFLAKQTKLIQEKPQNYAHL